MTREGIADAILHQLLKETFAPGRDLGPALSPFRRLAQDIVASGVPYLLVENDAAILCLGCGAVSHNPNDVANRYCGACHRWHDAV